MAYGTVMKVRNKRFNKGYYKVLNSKYTVISIGNLSLGGTGKTPFAIYLIENLQAKGLNPAFVSRGYGRRTEGLLEVIPSGKPEDFGDEPLMVKQRFPNIPVYVSEKRARAVEELHAKAKDLDVIIMDDAYQHRWVERDINILLSKFSQPYFYDQVVPGGRLREFREGASRADLILFTKSPEDISNEEKAFYDLKSKEYSWASVGFSHTIQLPIKFELSKLPLKANTEICLVTGLARPSELLTYMEHQFNLAKHFNYKDHHAFTREDVEQWLSLNLPIVCTEKDYVKIFRLLDNAEIERFAVSRIKIELNPDFEALLDEQISTSLK